MKKCLGFFAATMLAMGLVACGAVEDAATSSPQQENVSATNLRGEKVGVEKKIAENLTSVQPLLACPAGEHLCRTGCGGSYCEVNEVDCAYCFRVGTRCECY